MDLDKLEVEILGRLYSLEDDVLTRLCVHLKITEDGKTKRQVLKEIRSAIALNPSGEDETEIRSFLEALMELLIADMPPLEEEIDSDNEESETELSKLKREQEKLKKEIAELSKKANRSKVGEETQLSFRMAGENSLMRRELKISGTIGQPGETNKLNFISLIHQIEGALSKGYSEIEVREAVIKSISPGMTLRSFLECTPDLPLPKLRKILRSHYREKSSTELYKNLSTLTQAPNEDAQAFLFRALELRQRVIFTSKEADSKIKYDPEMIQRKGLIFGRRPPKIATGKIDQVTPQPRQTSYESKNGNAAAPETENQFLAALHTVQAGLAKLQASFEEYKVQSPHESKDNPTQTRPDLRSCEECKSREDTIKCNFGTCSQCKTVNYCTKNCQQKDWSGHKNICQAIPQSSRNRNYDDKIIGDSEDDFFYSYHLTPKTHPKIAKLIGEKCVMECTLDNIDMAVLLDTGAKVSIISKFVLHDVFLDTKISDISHILGVSQTLDLKRANGSNLPYV
eukprot:gene19811-21751_t